GYGADESFCIVSHGPARSAKAPCRAIRLRGPLRPPDLHQHGAVRGDLCGKGAVMHPELLLPPQVADGLAAVKAQVGPPGGDLRALRAAVEKADGGGAIPEGSRPDFESALLGTTARGAAEGILVDVQHLVVGEQARRPAIELGQIAGGKKGRGK